MDAHITGQKLGYARVSSVGQRLDRQVVDIGEVDRLFTDEVSGRSRSDRPGLNAALSWVRTGDELRVASMDRLARSLVDLESIVDELVQRGVVVSFVKEHMTFSADVSDSFTTFQRQLIGVHLPSTARGGTPTAAPMSKPSPMSSAPAAMTSSTSTCATRRSDNV